MHKQLVEIN